MTLSSAEASSVEKRREKGKIGESGPGRGGGGGGATTGKGDRRAARSNFLSPGSTRSVLLPQALLALF